MRAPAYSGRFNTNWGRGAPASSKRKSWNNRCPQPSPRLRHRKRAGMIWSVSIFGTAKGAATACNGANGSMSWPHQLTHVGELAGYRGGGRHRWAQKMGARALALAANEIAVGGRCAAIARRHQIAVHADAHGAARLAPLEARTLEDHVEALGFGLCLHQARARHHHRRHHGAPAIRDLSRCPQILDPAVGARADEDPVDGNL